MNGFLLLIPFLLIRFGLLSMIDNNAVQRAAHFAPMYGKEKIAYFICFIGMAALTRSWILFGFILAFQISSHWIILAEERECIQRFGELYVEYMKAVKRYI